MSISQSRKDAEPAFQASDPETVAAATRYVVLHRPGPAWNEALGPTEQPGVGAHIGYLHMCAERGDIALSGPFLSHMQGGMIILRNGLSAGQAEAICRDDPAVRSGLVTFEIRPWLITFDSMSKGNSI